jgi:SAM-dependent MidA family methyltransferase
MPDVETLLRDEILRNGPVSFHRFMDVALYHPLFGYYRSERDPFGKSGDFYTAEQIQPVFGILIATRIASLFDEMGMPEDRTVVELGAGRGEMADAFTQFRYVPIDKSGAMPDRFSGVVFLNEFFDALPIHVAVRRGAAWREMNVDWQDGKFVWREGGAAKPEVGAYLDQYTDSAGEGCIFEANLDALQWLEEIARRLDRGYIMAIDYGYTARELIRFPQGTLMSYHRHTASEDVLAAPGARDITAHVNFTALREHAARLGFETIRFESLARTLFDAGEKDQFAAALAGDSEKEQMRRRLQLKTLLYGMGETFRTLLLRKAGHQ